VESIRLPNRGAQINPRRPAHAMHLGVVDYAGTESGALARFLTWWPTPTAPGRSFALYSDYRMYNGGHAYRDIAKGFNQPGSYISLAIGHWDFIGPNTWYVEGSFNKEPVDLLRSLPPMWAGQSHPVDVPSALFRL
jgi:hypothetical protein